MLNKDHLSVFVTASKDDTRPVLTSVRFTSELIGTQNIIRMVSTDGYRLTEKTVEIAFKPTWEELMIPASTIELVSKVLKKHHRVLISENEFKIMNVKDSQEGYLERTITIGGTIEGNYPEYQSLIPKDEANYFLVVNKKYMIDALKQFDGENVILETRSNNEQLILKDAHDDTSIISVVMPLKS